MNIDIYTAAINNNSELLFSLLKDQKFDLFDWKVIGYLSGYGWIDTLKGVYIRWPKATLDFPWDFHSLVWACQNGCKDCLIFCLDNGCEWDNDRKSISYEPISNLIFDTHFDLECFDILLQRGYTFRVMNTHFDNIFGWLNDLADDIVEGGYLDTERWRKAFFPQEELIRYFVYKDFANALKDKMEEIEIQQAYSRIAYKNTITKDVVEYVLQGYL